MKKNVTFIFLFILFCNSIVAQQRYELITPIQNNDTIIYTLGKENLKICVKKDVGGLSVAEFFYRNDLKYISQDEGTEFNFEIFYNKKQNNAFLFAHKQLEYSRGCETFFIEKNIITPIGLLPVAAYIKKDKTMEYTNILPYLSIVKISDRILMSFETPLVVLYPSTKQEQIVESNKIFYIFSNNKLEKQEH
ncbi:MAG: hypothetical protein LBR28_01620 [Bacteroidales bacterium]|jgi:hypothetical protein|nr:hypothetical protein [Bacteroidales bacterium]